MVRPAQTARSERTREALRQAALVRFLAQGVEDTSAEQIAADAGVSLRTFYRHFTSKHDLLFADYDAGLEWFRAALASRGPNESVVDAVHSAVMAAPYDTAAVSKIAELRTRVLDPARIVRHIRQVEADFAEAVEEYLLRDGPPASGTDERLRITVTARCIAAAVFGAMEVWMLSEDRSLPELARLSRTALEAVAAGVGERR
jgi:AcrR family transcriptional regulator